MPENMPTITELEALLGEPYYELLTRLSSAIDEKYDMEHQWTIGGKGWIYEYKYRRGGQTLCSLCVRASALGLSIIFEPEEQAQFEAQRQNFSPAIQQAYDQAPLHREAKLLTLRPQDRSLFREYLRLLSIKKRPNK